MDRYEEAKSQARKLDVLYPQFYHMVGVNYHIIRVRKYIDE